MLDEIAGWVSNAGKAWVWPTRRRGLILLGALILLLMTGCKEDPTIWSARSQSPDGNWLAYAHTVQHSGMGTNGVETIVEIKRRTGLRSSERVLGFAEDGSSIGLKMIWASPYHLEVLFKDDDPKVLYYQVIKTSGVEISVRNLAEP